MTSRPNTQSLFGDNRLLASLPQPERQHLRASLKPVQLPKGKIIYGVGDTVGQAYFLTSGMVSLLSTTIEGATVQVAMVGREGFIGLPVILRNNLMPYQVIVQLPATALRISASSLNAAFQRGGALQNSLLRYTHALITQITQSAVCNRYHTVEARLCRWLLISHDRVRADIIPLTQESLAHMLGVQRTGVTMAAGTLERAGLIHQMHGKIQLIDRVGLEAASCECYQIVSAKINQFSAA